MATLDTAQSLENLKLERDAIQLYEALASIERDSRRADAFRTIAGNERRHAEIWAKRLRDLGAVVPPAAGARFRIRVIIAIARVFGTNAVRDLVLALEGDEEDTYNAQATPEVEAIAADEREHVEIWKRLSTDRGAELEKSDTGASAAARATIAAGATGHSAAPAGVSAPGEIVARERWHRAGRSGTLRAVIFGVSDGLVSNLALVMGVAGANAAINGRSFVLLAGVAGLLAGAFSMAAGEYISMQSQRELFERQIALERAELEAMPAEEEAELASVYRSKGFTADEATTIAHRMFADPEHALDTLIREELGLDPDELGSPWGAAFGSFVAFAIGAAVPVVPYLFDSGGAAFAFSLGASLVALFLVGAGVSLLTGRSLLFSGARQVAIGAAAAGITYVVGNLIGVSVAGWMPDLRAIVIAFGVGFGVGGYFTLWWHWPLAIGGGLGLVLGGLALVGTMSVAKDPTIADEAWKAAAPEFVDPPTEPGPDSRPDAATSTNRSHDLPSGD